jgi:hypothetical protein
LCFQQQLLPTIFTIFFLGITYYIATKYIKQKFVISSVPY